jgi:carbonic anhydrase
MKRTALAPLLGVVAAGALLISGCATSDEETVAASPAEGPHWSYEGNTGPVGWGDLDPDFETCSTGTRQSPVDLTSSITSGGPMIEVATSPSEGEVEDTGHTVQITDDGDGSVVSYAGSTYTLAQMHVHTPSEHTVDGLAAEAEFHFVHQNEAGDRLVIGVLAEEGAESAAYESFAKRAAEASSTDEESDLDLDVSALLPASLDHFAYQGSLTTPPCTENVQWIVLSSPIELSSEQLDELDDAHPGNTRPTQPLGDRDVTGGSGVIQQG